MSKIEWNKAGERFFEAGVDQGVFYPRVGPGVPWNGLVSVQESSDGGEMESFYFDGVKYMDFVSNEDFSAQVEAYAAPREFDASDGVKQLMPGLYVTQQPRKTFGLSYRTLIGNDLVGEEYGYKLHVVYNCTAKPSGRNNQTIAGTPNPDKRSWEINTVPPPATTFRPTAHLVFDSTVLNPDVLFQIEAMLYGHDGAAPYLPSLSQILGVFDSKITPLVTELV